MDTGNGTKAVYTDAAGKPMTKPSSGADLASPIDLLNPDRYEFYTFDDNGDLVKRLMTWDEIQGIIASGDGDGFSSESFTSQGYIPEKRVDDVVNNVHNVLKEEIQSHKESSIDHSTLFDTPDVSETWSMILPAIFGNSGETIKPEKPIMHGTPDTIMIEPIATSPQPSTVLEAKQEVTTAKLVSDSIKASTREAERRPVTMSVPKRPSTTEGTKLSPNTASESTTKSVSSVSPQESVVVTVGVRNVSDTTKATISTTDSGELRTPLPILDQTASGSFSKYNVQSTNGLSYSRVTPSVNYVKSTTRRPQTSRRPIVSSTVRGISSTRRPIPSSSKPTASPVTRRTTLKTTTTSTTPIMSPVSVVSIDKIPSSSERTSTTVESASQLSSLKPEATSSEHADLPTSSTPIFIIRTVPNRVHEVSSTRKPDLTTSPVSKYSASTVGQQQNFSSRPLYEKSPETTPLPSNIVPVEEQTTNIPEITSTFGSLVTFFSISDNKRIETTTDLPTTTRSISESENISNAANDLLMKESVTETNAFSISTNNNDDISEAIATSTEDASNESDAVTTELIADETTNILTKISATEILDQLLLTPNIIYEINTQLSEQPLPTTTTITQVDDKTEISSRTDATTVIEENYKQSSRTDVSTTELSTIVKENKTAAINDETLIESVEKLILQATSNVDTSSVNLNSTDTIENMIYNSTNKTMGQIQSETATLASAMLDSPNIEEVTTKNNLIAETILSDSVESILSQVFGPSLPSLTTIDYETTTENYVTTERPTTVSVGKSENEATTNSLVTFLPNDLTLETTTYSEERSTLDTTFNPELATELQNTEFTSTDIREDTTESTNQYNKILDDNISEDSQQATRTEPTTTVTYEPHIINITIISSQQNKNLTKPAKSDTSLEVEYDEDEELKNPSEPNKSNNELLTAEASSSLQESPSTLKGSLSSSTANNIESTPPSDILKRKTETIATSEASVATPALESMHKPTDTTTKISKNTTEDLKNHQELDAKPNETSNKQQITTAQNQQTPTPLVYTTTEQILSDKPSIAVKISENALNSHNPNNVNNSEPAWAPVSTIAPYREENPPLNDDYKPKYPMIDQPKPVDLVPKPLQGYGLEDSTAHLDTDIYHFAQLCNELAFGFWKSVTNGISQARSVVISPFAATSLLAMVFLGARGATSGEMNEILKLDDMVTFNPHLIFKNVSESIEVGRDSKVAVSAIIRELYSDRSKGKLLSFYKERARQFYDGHVEEVSFKEIGDVIRRRTNLLIKKQSGGKISEFLRDNSIVVKSPLGAVSTSIFQVSISVHK